MFEVLEKNGVDLAQCELDNSDEVQLVHQPTNSEFKIQELPRVNGGGFRLWLHVPDGLSGNFLAGNWDDLLEQLAEWADEVRYVTETPDLWAELRRVPEILAATGAQSSNAAFTLDERAEIARGIDEIKSLVREKFELTSEQLSAIDERLDQVKEASERLGRKDWLMMFYGAAMSVFLTDAVPPSVVQTVLATVVHGIAHLFGFGDPPSMITT